MWVKDEITTVIDDELVVDEVINWLLFCFCLSVLKQKSYPKFPCSLCCGCLWLSCGFRSLLPWTHLCIKGKQCIISSQSVAIAL